MAKTRVETDLLGQRELRADALVGIHTLRAAENFDVSGIRLQFDAIFGTKAVEERDPVRY
ncbi:hypothetical protein [Ensifer aridi]|uniref:hypothetical protein n=1 Tax=Ensifer aridi TaxID=1708715 RepID=UPI0009BE1489|nr:hypothetical protein [Ensifer aridi]